MGGAHARMELPYAELRGVVEPANLLRATAASRRAVAELALVVLAPAPHDAARARAGVGAAGSDLVGVEALHGDGDERVVAGDAELPGVVGAPAFHVAVRQPRARMLEPDGELDGRRDAAHRRRVGTVVAPAIAELSAIVLSPANDGAVLQERAAVSAAGRHRLRLLDRGHGRRVRPRLERPVTELTRFVGAPALHRAVREHGARVMPPRREIADHEARALAVARSASSTVRPCARRAGARGAAVTRREHARIGARRRYVRRVVGRHRLALGIADEPSTIARRLSGLGGGARWRHVDDASPLAACAVAARAWRRAAVGVVRARRNGGRDARRFDGRRPRRATGERDREHRRHQRQCRAGGHVILRSARARSPP